MLDLDLSNASVSPIGDDENWMKHTLSWLDKPHVEDAKVRSPTTKSSQLSWIGGWELFLSYWRSVPFWCFRVPKKVLRVIVLGIPVYPLISMAGGWMLFANIGTWFTHDFNKWLGSCPKKLIFYPILCGILKSQDLKPLQWRWCSSTGGSLISPSIRCRNGQVGEWYGGWKLAKIESDWRCM